MRALLVLLSTLAAACSSSASAPAGLAKHSVVFEGAPVVYSDLGAGDEALVFVHGWACDRSVWDEQMRAVGTRHAIAIDLPGHGASGLPQATLTMDLFARSIAESSRTFGTAYFETATDAIFCSSSRRSCSSRAHAQKYASHCGSAIRER